MSIKCKPGDRVILKSTSDPYTKLVPGDTGTVSFVDAIRTVHVDWDVGSTLGLIPGEDSSGEQERNTGISHRRNAHLRGMLIECSWVAAREDPALLMAFGKLSKRMVKNRAIVRIARKLLNRIRYVLKHQEPYKTSVVM